MPASVGAVPFFFNLVQPEIPRNWVDSDMFLSKLDQDKPISADGSGWLCSISRWELFRVQLCVVLLLLWGVIVTVGFVWR